MVVHLVFLCYLCALKVFELFFIMQHLLSHTLIKRCTLCAILISLFLPPCFGEVVVLRSGKVLQGEILVHNQDVLIMRDTDGIRRQYPTSSILSIKADEEQVNQTEEVLEVSESTTQKSSLSAVVLRFQVSAGACMIPNETFGSAYEVGMAIGTRTLMNKRIFLGGGIRYQYVLLDKKEYSILPIEAMLSVALSEHQHAPEIGMNVGYGFAFGGLKGGVCGGAKIGWRWQFSNKSALLLSGYIHMQQVESNTFEVIDNQTYSYTANRGLLTTGLNVSVQF